MKPVEKNIVGVDLFCGAGGLTLGLRCSGITVAAGIDIDSACAHAYTNNNPAAEFHAWNIETVQPAQVNNLFNGADVRLLAGCAPCQPFSKYTNT